MSFWSRFRKKPTYYDVLEDEQRTAVLEQDRTLAAAKVRDIGAGALGGSLEDTDGDTKVQVEEGTDDDTWRVDCAGNEELKCTDTQFTCNPNADFGAGVDVTGNITVTGTTDGRDVAADGTKLDGVATGADVTADNAPQAHKTSHQNAGGDEISVAGLSGLLADDQHVLDAEAISAVEGEATLDLAGDVTIAAAKSLAVDTISEKTGAAGVTIDGVTLKDDAVEVDAVRGLKESGGQALDMGAVADGEYLKRSGTDVVGDTPAGGGDVTAAANIADHTVVRGDGGVKGVQDSGITVDDSDNVSGMGTLGCGAITSSGDIKAGGALYPSSAKADARMAVSGDDVYLHGDFTDSDYIKFTHASNLWGLYIAATPYLYTTATQTTIVPNCDFSGGIDVTGDITATGTVLPTGDTAAADAAALGYTAAEGAILTGQGSTSDVTIKNDADGTVISIPTGTTITKLASEIWFTERADHESTPAAGYGYLWVKNTAPSTLIFTDDAGTDTTLGAGGGGGATTALDNLASVAINTSLISDADSTDDLGSSSKYWANAYIDKLYLNATATLDGGTAGKVNLTGDLQTSGTIGVAGTAPSSTSAITLTKSVTGSYVGTTLTLTATFSGNSQSVSGVSGGSIGVATAGQTGELVYGLLYYARSTTVAATATFASVYGVDASCAANAITSGTQTVTKMAPLRVRAFSSITTGSAVVAVTEYMGLDIADPANAKIATAYGVKVADITTAATANYIAWFGGATPQLRVDGGAYAVANKTACVYNMNGTQYRLIRNAGTGAAEWEAI